MTLLFDTNFCAVFAPAQCLPTKALRTDYQPALIGLEQLWSMQEAEISDLKIASAAKEKWITELETENARLLGERCPSEEQKSVPLHVRSKCTRQKPDTKSGTGLSNPCSTVRRTEWLSAKGKGQERVIHYYFSYQRKYAK
jgi:hypothetical protein